jgi:hypothetical protein
MKLLSIRYFLAEILSISLSFVYQVFIAIISLQDNCGLFSQLRDLLKKLEH